MNKILEPPVPAPGETCGCTTCADRPQLLPRVHLFSGEFFETAEDLRIRGRGLDFVWARKYRSRSGPNTAHGNRWDFSYNIRVEPGPDDTVKLFNGDGREDVFARQPDGTFGRDEFFVVGRKNDDGTFSFTFPDRGTWKLRAFDDSAGGKISEIVDRNGNRLAFNYDYDGRLIEIVDTLNRPIRVEYDRGGFIQSVTDFIGRQVVYTYYGESDPNGSFGDLATVTRPAVIDTPNGNDFPKGKTSTYTYSKDFADERLNHNLLTITDPNGQTYLKNVYTETEEPEDFDFCRLRRQIWGGDERDVIDIVYEVMHSRDPNGPVVMAIVNDRNRNVKEFLFDSKNRCISKREYTGRAPQVAHTTVSDNRPTGQLREDDPPFFETRYEWNSDSLLTRLIDPNGKITERQFEAELNPNVDRRFRGNLRELRFLPGPLGGEQSSLVQTFEYEPGFGCSCADSFVSKATDARGNVTVQRFDDRGNVVSIQHRIDSIVEDFEYDKWGQLTRHVHPDNGSGHRRVDRVVYYTEADGHQNGYVKEQVIDADNLALATSYEYDPAGNATHVIDPDGHDSLYVWNALDQNVRRLSAENNDRGERCVVDFFYDANDNKIRKSTHNWNDERAVQTLNTTRDYDVFNQCIRVSRQVTPDHRVVTEYAYDQNGNLAHIRYGEATNGNQPANGVQMIYDERDLLFRKIRAAGDKLQSTTQYDYDPGRNRTRTRIGLEDQPREYLRAYDGYGRVMRLTDPAGTQIEYSHDSNGNVLSQQIRGATRYGAAAELRVFESRSVFDDMDRLTAVEVDYFDTETQSDIGRGKSVFRTEYAANSAVIRKIDDNGHETRIVYDTANRKRDEIDHLGNTVTHEYDRSSNVVRVTEVEKSDGGRSDQRSVTTLEYDDVARLVAVSDSSGNTQRFTYDCHRNLRSFVDTLGNETRFKYDGLRRLTSASRVLTDNGKPNDAIVTTQTWDDSSRLTSRRDPNGNVTTYSYDPLNREISETYADGTAHSYTYDVHGNRIASIDPNGTVIKTSYDLLDRPIETSIAAGEGVSKLVTRESYEYDALSRLTRAQNDHSVVTRSYDSLSHVVREELNERKVARAFDGVGNKLRCTYPCGREITFDYDELNRKTKVADARGPIAAYRYMGASRLAVREVQGSQPAIVTSYDYDENKHLIRTKHDNGAGEPPLANHEYAWDLMHNKTRRSESQNGTQVLTRDYTYDSIYRLRQSAVSERGRQPSLVQYELDPAGNRVNVNGGTTPGAYVLSCDKPEPADSFVNQYTATPFDERRYDRNGNLILVASKDGKRREITYDHRNRITNYSVPAGRIAVSYQYDALGRRISKSVGPENVTRYFHDGWQVVEEEDPDGDVTTFVYGTRLDGILNMQRANHDFYFHVDDQGSVTAVTDDAGKVVERYRYEDFGEPSIFDSGGNLLRESRLRNPYLFTGQRYDQETGLYYYRTRYLDPLAGRFTSRDTIGIWEDAGNLGNGYTYVRNNPHSFTDPTGASILRTIPCNGPWPGPAQVTVEYEGCSSTRRAGLDSPVCRAFRGAGRASADLLTLWVKDFTGSTIPSPAGTGAETTRARVVKWFGGPDNATSTSSKSIIMDHFDAAFDALDENDVDIDCETGCASNENAYVNWGGYDVNLCSNFFNSGFSNSKKAAILVHELTHAYADTDDYCYYPNDLSNLPWNLLFETPTLRENADSYEQFLLEFYP
ncbi:MAG TPA: RHS repeat-associated core domain-containing protein [Pyrinomonadaceae bacterium]|nr:RHS repeat-associated core domain-containing protein [Pyrinomonadaceae bacterium]